METESVQSAEYKSPDPEGKDHLLMFITFITKSISSFDHFEHNEYKQHLCHKSKQNAYLV